jgi:hypothetical protein
LHKLHINLVYIIALLFILLHSLFYFTYIQHLVLDNHSVELGTQDKEFFFGRLHNENKESFFNYSPRVRYKSRVSSCGKFTLATTLCTWSPKEMAHFLVSSYDCKERAIMSILMPASPCLLQGNWSRQPYTSRIILIVVIVLVVCHINHAPWLQGKMLMEFKIKQTPLQKPTGGV